MNKHIVEVVTPFTITYKLGALIAGGKEIAPAYEETKTYNKGDTHTFRTKADALKFCHAHGPKVRYVKLMSQNQ